MSQKQQVTDSEQLDILLVKIHDGIKETIDALSSGTGLYGYPSLSNEQNDIVLTKQFGNHLWVDTGRHSYRISECIFVINVADFVQNAIIGDTPNRRRNVEEVVRIMDDPSITVESVEQDTDTGVYLSRWVEEFGTLIYMWSSFDMDIAQFLPRSKFETLMTIFHQDSQKRQAALAGIRQLQPQQFDVQQIRPGNTIRAHYMKFLTTDVYRNHREKSEKRHRENRLL